VPANRTPANARALRCAAMETLRAVIMVTRRDRHASTGRTVPAAIGLLPIVRRAAAVARSVPLHRATIAAAKSARTPRAATARIIIATTARRVATAAMPARPRVSPTRNLATSGRTLHKAKALTENLAATRNFRVEPAGIGTAARGTVDRARILAAAPIAVQTAASPSRGRNATPVRPTTRG